MKKYSILILLLLLPFLLAATPQEDFLIALRESRLQDASFYLRGGVSINEPLLDGQPVLNIMCRELRSSIVRWLIDKGADPDIRDNDGLSPLMYAAQRGNRDIAQILLLAGAQINLRDPFGNTALQIAVNHGHWQLADFLEKRGGTLGEGYFEHPVLSEVWTRREHYRETLMLIENRWPSYEFLKAVRDGDYKKTLEMLREGASPDAADSRGVTALMISASLDSPFISELLLQEGADPSAEDELRLTALWYAAFQGRRDLIDALLERGVSLDSSYLELSPLFAAFAGQQYDTMDYLISAGSDPELSGRLGARLVHYGAFNGDMRTLKILERHDVSMTVPDGDGKTSLDYLITGFNLNESEERYLPAAQFLKDKKTDYTIDPEVTGSVKLEKIITYNW